MALKFLISSFFAYLQKIEPVNHMVARVYLSDSFSKMDVAFPNLIFMTLILELIYLSSFLLNP